MYTFHLMESLFDRYDQDSINNTYIFFNKLTTLFIMLFIFTLTLTLVFSVLSALSASVKDSIVFAVSVVFASSNAYAKFSVQLETSAREDKYSETKRSVKFPAYPTSAPSTLKSKIVYSRISIYDRSRTFII